MRTSLDSFISRRDPLPHLVVEEKRDDFCAILTATRTRRCLATLSARCSRWRLAARFRIASASRKLISQNAANNDARSRTLRTEDEDGGTSRERRRRCSRRSLPSGPLAIENLATSGFPRDDERDRGYFYARRRRVVLQKYPASSRIPSGERGIILSLPAPK